MTLMVTLMEGGREVFLRNYLTNAESRSTVWQVNEKLKRGVGRKGGGDGI